MSPSLLLLLLVALLASLVAAAPVPRAATPQWYTVEWDADEFTAMSGDWVVPALPNGAKAGTPYVWPGLQSDSGVLQATLDGSSGQWSLANAFYGAPSLPQGSPFTVQPGDTVHFSFSRASASSAWTCTLSGPHTAEQTFSVPGNTMTRAILAVDLTNVAHDFAVTYSNVIITAASTPAEQWCATSWSNGYAKGGYTVTDAITDGTTCRIGQVVMPGTA